MALQRTVDKQRWNQPSDVAPCFHGNLRVLSKQQKDLTGVSPNYGNHGAHRSEHKDCPLLVDAKKMVLLCSKGLPTQRVQAARHARLKFNASIEVDDDVQEVQLNWCIDQWKKEKNLSYQQAEASYAGEGGCDGGTRESEFAEMTHKHDG